MRMRTVKWRAAAERLRRLTDGPFEVGIGGALAYCLGDLQGSPLGPESDRTLAPFAQALESVRAGRSPESMVVWSRLTDGERYRVAGGAALVDLAEAAAGVPAKPRVLRE